MVSIHHRDKIDHAQMSRRPNDVTSKHLTSKPPKRRTAKANSKDKARAKTKVEAKVTTTRKVAAAALALAFGLALNLNFVLSKLLEKKKLLEILTTRRID